MCDNSDITLYTALSIAPDPLAGHEPDENIYHSAGQPISGKTKVKMPFTGFLPDNEYGLLDTNYTETNEFDIAWTKWGETGPPVIFIHGVPTNRRQWYDAQKRVAKFARTLSFDLLGMGESDKPRFYGNKEINEYEKSKGKKSINDPWDWKYDSIYIKQLVDEIFPNQKIAVVADDWGGGIATWFAAQYNDIVVSLTKVNSIDFDGYPVSEIQAIGRSSQFNDEDFMKGMAAFDQTLVQIYKNMVNHQAVYNQYKLRDIKFPYVDTDYERSMHKNGENATSLTLRIKFQNIRVLADRARVLAPDLLLPYDCHRNLRGIPVRDINMRLNIINSGPNGDIGTQISGDSMMPSNQGYLNLYAYPFAKNFTFHYVENAGHFVATDRPRLVAEYIIIELINTFGRAEMADISLGFTGIWKGDEVDKIKQLRLIYNIK